MDALRVKAGAFGGLGRRRSVGFASFCLTELDALAIFGWRESFGWSESPAWDPCDMSVVSVASRRVDGRTKGSDIVRRINIAGLALAAVVVLGGLAAVQASGAPEFLPGTAGTKLSSAKLNSAEAVFHVAGNVTTIKCKKAQLGPGGGEFTNKKTGTVDAACGRDVPTVVVRVGI